VIRTLVALLLLALLVEIPAAAQNLAASRFDGIDDVDKCQSYASIVTFGTYPVCTIAPTLSKLGRLRVVQIGTPHDLATTETKGSHATVGTGLVMRRSDSTNGPPACPSPPTPCFTYQDNLASMTTCFESDEVSSVRGQSVADGWANVVGDVLASASSERPGGQRPIIVQSVRWDLVTWPEMQLDGFQRSFLVETPTADFTAFEAWLNDDRSTPCPSGCSWTYSDRGSSTSWINRDEGIRVSDFLTTLGGDPEGYAYYMTRPDDDPLYPTAVVADQNDSAYRAWKLAHVQSLMAESGADMVHLNHKLSQYTGPNDGWNNYVLHADNCGGNTVDEFFSGTCGAHFTSGGFAANVEAAGYGRAQYIAGWYAIGQELRAAGIRYFVNTNGNFLSTNWYDESSTGGVNENDLVRDTVYGASLVWITDGNETNEANLRAELASRGIPYVNGDCAYQ